VKPVNRERDAADVTRSSVPSEAGGRGYFRDHGAAWRSANAGRISLGQLKVMSAIESCRTAALGGHVERCEKCSHTIIAYNSCLMGRSSNGELAAT
jgi:hypothetical protein